MNTLPSFKVTSEFCRRIVGTALLLVLTYSLAFAQAEQEQAPPIPAGELDSLVAPVALYPDTMLAQTLAASTYPLEVMQLDQWMKKNNTLKDKALADAVAKQPWDPSVQAMAAFPDVVTRMSENIQWMTDIGNAFLAQQKDVMDAVQRMRVKAQGTGNLKTSSEAKVETQTQGGQQVVVIEQANPQSAYVPSYDPAVVYGPPPAQYPYYPYSYPGWQAGTALAWGTGIAVGAAWSNNWGNCNWGGGDITINNNNNFNKNSINNVNRGTGQGNGWQHNPQHRGNTPYANKQTANKYGGTARGESRTAGGGAAGRAGTRPGGQDVGAGNRAGGAGDRTAGAGDRAGDRSAGGGGARAGSGDRAGGVGGSAGNRDVGGTGARAGGNSVGNRSVSSGSGGNAFGGAGGPSAKAASNRGGASMHAGGGGGGRAAGGGGGRGGGGGGRGGGGGGRRR